MQKLIAGPGPAVDRPIILFDLGNILVHLRSVDRFWLGQSPKPGTRSYSDRWKYSESMHHFETGRITDFSDFYQLAKSELDFPIDKEAFQREYLQIIGDVFAETVPILEALYSRFSLQLLSNTSAVHWQHCAKTLGLGQYFDRVLVSYELGYMKPDPEIFKLALVEINQDPETIYYFDDRPENIETARKFGINAHLSWGGTQLIKQLRELSFLL
ncbi:MAG: HAD family phosphatase [Eubacteriales bacterium]|nr:HAD family phosphatase [Eubacteriales bacterium]